jgi:branched-chain amino acid transport system ATP-binding protein
MKTQLPAQASTGAASALSVHGISKRFGGVPVFKDISFQLQQEEVLGVIGPNGAGKTTLINVVSGMLPATEGCIMLGQSNVTGNSFCGMSRLGIVRSFQQTNTFRSGSARENLERAARFSHQAGPDIDMDTLLNEFGLASRLHEPSDKLPYGMQKMLGLLMALATRPKFLLLDEPAAGLERRERVYIDRFVQHARARLGCGVLIVEHDMDMVKRLCPKILVLESGRFLAAGTPDEVLSRKDVIAAYLGASEEETC